MLKAAIPIVHVSDSVAAEDFYCKGLGFTVLASWRPDEANEDPCYMTMVRDEAWLHVTSFKDGAVGSSAVYALVADIDALYAEFVAKGIPVPHPPIDQTWGTREISVRDADGNKILFGQRIPDPESKPNVK